MISSRELNEAVSKDVTHRQQLQSREFKQNANVQEMKNGVKVNKLLRIFNS